MINVFNIEKFATHDGPGIRTTIFLKGCSLHCPWCANPESWTIKPTLMYDSHRCLKCRQCANQCLNHAITFEKQWTYDSSKCIHCQKCVQGCVHNALEFAGTKMAIDEIMSEVLKDQDYFENSGGGVTLSGGEPFVQFEKMLELIKELKKYHLHVAVETTGNYHLDLLKEALPYIDLFLFDVKHIDEAKLKHVTGGNPQWIFSNLQYLLKNDPHKVIVRVPVIPGFNADEKTIQNIIDFGKKLDVNEIHLLPYHSLGKGKWDRLLKDYQYKDLPMMDKNELHKYLLYGESVGIKIKIGG